MKKKETKNQMIKLRVTPEEKEKLKRMAFAEGTDVSTLLRNHVLFQKPVTATHKDSEQIFYAKQLMADLCSLINQYHAGIKTEQVVLEIERIVCKLWHLYV